MESERIISNKEINDRRFGRASDFWIRERRILAGGGEALPTKERWDGELPESTEWSISSGLGGPASASITAVGLDHTEEGECLMHEG